jgi:3-hydroxyisobutyrate dehydrogenase-like beta-hydroxyacid dehydrogenase
MSLPASVALIGLGEVGGLFARDLRARGVDVLFAYDPKFKDPSSPPSANLTRYGLVACASAGEAASQAELTVCAVTAAQTERAAADAAEAIARGAVYLDLNSSSPGAKTAAAAAINGAGARYVEAAVMTPAPAHGIASPMLLGGPHASAFLPQAEALGMRVRIASERYGVAAATKLCRSVMIKGTEALIAESLLSARHYGVDATVLASLGDLLPNPDWEKLAQYMLSRSLEHGVRRAEEMREAARTVAEAGIEPLMARATVERQEWAAARRAGLGEGVLEGGELGPLLDAILAQR